MSTQPECLLLPLSAEAKVDAEIAQRYFEVTSGPAAFEALQISPGRLKELEVEFVAADRSLDVDLSVKTEEEAVNSCDETALLEFKEDLRSANIPDYVRHAYRWAINEKLAARKMIEASASGNMEHFARWNRFIYGSPDEDIYRAALDWVCHDAETLLDDPAVSAKAEEVLCEFNDDRGYRELLIPDPELFDRVRKDHFRQGGYYGLLLAGVEIPRGVKITREAGDPVLKYILRHNIGSTKTIEDAPGTTWSLSHHRNAVLRPLNYKLDDDRFIGLPIGHEIGSHELEYINGQRGPLALAQAGLDRTEQGNEGRAVIREQVAYETFDEFGQLLRWRDIIRRHIAVSLGAGADGENPRSFSQVYRALNTIDTMYALSEKAKDPNKKAHTRSWSLTTRVLKGTDGTGGASLKDMVYLEGNVACWLTAALRGPEAIRRGDLGKFDIANPRHIAVLQEAGLLPTHEE